MNSQVIVPTYNERENLAKLLPSLLELPELEVLVVDDESPDGTGQLADEIASASSGRVRVMHRKGPRGLGSAYKDGIAVALSGSARVICQMDADLSHDPGCLPDLIEATDRFDLVVGSRYVGSGGVTNWSPDRVFLSKFANLYVRLVTGITVRDCTSGFRCWRREALEQIPLVGLRSSGYSLLTEMLLEASDRGYRIHEAPIIFEGRRIGDSKVSAAVLIESAVTPWRFAAGLRDRLSR